MVRDADLIVLFGILDVKHDMQMFVTSDLAYESGKEG